MTGWLGTGTGSPVTTPSLKKFKKNISNATMPRILGCSVQKLDLMILVGFFQLSIFSEFIYSLLYV